MTQSEQCHFCLQIYEYEMEYRCLLCDDRLCPFCILDEAELVCPECLPDYHGTSDLEG